MALNTDIFDQVQELLGSVSTAEAEDHIHRLTKEIEAKREEQQRWYSLLGLKQQLGEATKVANGQGPAQATPTLRQAIRLVFEGHGVGAVISLSTLRDELQRRGWLGETENEYHRLQMMASNMVKRDQLERPKKGLYRLPSQSDDAEPGGGEVG